MTDTIVPPIRPVALLEFCQNLERLLADLDWRIGELRKCQRDLFRFAVELADMAVAAHD